MNANLTPNNCMTLDKICSTIKSEYLSIDTHSKICLQLLSESKNLVGTVVLSPEYFETLEVLHISIKINKPKFYYPKMRHLSIKVISNFVIFEFDFELYIHRYRYVIYRSSLYQVPFTIRISDYIDHNLFYKAVSEFKSEICIRFKDKKAVIEGEGTCIKFECNEFGGIRFSVDALDLKNILSIFNLFDSCLLNWDEDESPLNINFYSACVSVFYFIAT